MIARVDDILAAAARNPAHGVRFIDRREAAHFHPYAAVYARARQVAASLVGRGLRPGDHVALVLPTAASFLHAFFGTLLAGGVPVPLYPPARLGRLDEYHARTGRMLQVAGARLVLTDARLRRLLGVAVEAGAPALGCLDVDDLRAPAEPFVPPPRAPDDVAFIQFSSGTTVDPKPVMLTHAAIVANARAILAAVFEAYPATDACRHAGVSWLPLYHDMGLIGGVLTSMLGVPELSLIPSELFVADPGIWLRTLSRYRGTLSPAPNFAYSLCTERIDDADLAGVDLSAWRVALNGAEAVTPAVLEAFSRRFAAFGLRPEALTPVYGLAEAALAVTFAPLHRPCQSVRFDAAALEADRVAHVHPQGRPMVSVGAPLRGYALQVVDDAARALPAGQVGRVRVRGPSIMVGYYGNPDATRRALADGWLDTGDEGFVHGGELFLCGRRKDLIILRGRNLAPQDLEQCLDGLPGLRTGCCVAASYLPPDAASEVLLVLVEHRAHWEAHPAAVAALVAAVRLRLREAFALEAHAIAVLAPGTLPRTSSGKLRRAEACAQHLRGTLRPPKRVGPVRLAQQVLRSRWALARAAWRRPTAPPLP